MKNFKQKAISLILGICLVSGCATMASAANRPTCRSNAAAYRIVQVLYGKNADELLKSLTNDARVRQFMAQFFTAPKTQDEPCENCDTPAVNEPENCVDCEKPAPSEPEECIDCETPKDETPAPIETPAEVPQTQNLALDYEKKVVELVNAQRRAYGLAPVALSEELCVKARVKSQDMAKNRYFDHNSPTYGSPFAMMQQLGVSYRFAGENIAMGYATPEAVVNAWMNSEGHRANILNANYQTLGVGYVADGNYWTQWFIG